MISCNIEINEQEDLLLCEGEIVQLDLSPINSLETCIEFEQFPQYNHRSDRSFAYLGLT